VPLYSCRAFRISDVFSRDFGGVMTISRRSFLHLAGAGSAGMFAAHTVGGRGREAFAAALDDGATALSADALRLDSNENPNGPFRTALVAIRDSLGEASRYPKDVAAGTLAANIARAHRTNAKHVVVGSGSTEILRVAVLAFSSPDRPLVIASPTFESPARDAERFRIPVRAIPVDRALRLDLDAMAEVSHGAGLVYVCNPNNPTGTVLGADRIEAFVQRLAREAPDAMIVIDEAYHEYVEDPAYATAIPLALSSRRVVVTRTFSKVYGLAGMRVGYAIGHADAIAAMDRFRLQNAVSALGARAATASLGRADEIDRERRANLEARTLATKGFADLGFDVATSEANFVMVDIRRDATAFQTACRERGVLVGRPFPPLTTHARISIGTADEMRAAMDVFRRVLRSA
jgi:histidinol-phosphate aminotransferase